MVANETLGGRELQRLIEERSRDMPTEILVCTPALNSRLRHWASDEDGARAAAQARLDASLERLRALGIDASGEVGDANPLQAMEDALRTFGADEIIISTHPEGRSNWLERVSSSTPASGSPSRSGTSSSTSTGARGSPS